MENIIAAVILIVAMAAIVGLTIHNMKKTNKNLTIDEFLNVYHDELIGVLQDVVALLLINIDEFVDKESYEKAIISTTIMKLEENCAEFGVDTSLFNLFNKDTLTDMLYSLLHSEKLKVFLNSVPKTVIEAKPELYDEVVVTAAHEE